MERHWLLVGESGGCGSEYFLASCIIANASNVIINFHLGRSHYVILNMGVRY